MTAVPSGRVVAAAEPCPRSRRRACRWRHRSRRSSSCSGWPASRASARPFVIKRDGAGSPPVPVLVPTPAPVRLNHSSRVNADAPSSAVPAAAPNVTNWLDPLSWTPALVTSKPVDPPWRGGGRRERPVVAPAGDVDGGRAAAVVEMPQPDQAGLRRRARCSWRPGSRTGCGRRSRSGPRRRRPGRSRRRRRSRSSRCRPPACWMLVASGTNALASVSVWSRAPSR